jgi:hypothetical protein
MASSGWEIAQFGGTASPNYKLPLDCLKYATTLNGLASVEIETPSSLAFFNQIWDLSFNPELQKFLVDCTSHTEPLLYDEYTFNKLFPILTTFTYTGFVALMTLGISACGESTISAVGSSSSSISSTFSVLEQSGHYDIAKKYQPSPPLPGCIDATHAHSGMAAKFSNLDVGVLAAMILNDATTVSEVLK